MKKAITLLLAIFFSSNSLSAQSFELKWLEEHPREALDSMALMTRYHGYYRERQPYYEAVVDTMLYRFVESELDSIWVALAYKNAYKVIPKRDLKPYFERIRAISNYAPKDSVHLHFFSKYMIGNAFIFRESYDSAAFYLNAALDYDEGYDLGPYEGAVSERLSMIFYRLGDYKRSLQFAKLTLDQAGDNLKGAVYNQLANTYTNLQDYELAAAAYDSAAYYYQGANNQGWWMPIYNSLTAHLELRDSTRFMEAYNKIKDVPYIKESGEFHHLLNMSRAEFTLTEWKRASEGENASYGGMVLKRTPENEKWIRGVLQQQVNYTKSEWRDHRYAIYLVKRWYDLCEPDSSVYAYERILELDKQHSRDEVFNTNSAYLEKGNIKELQRLVSRLSYSILKERLREVSEAKAILIGQSQNITLFASLLMVSLFGLWRIKKLSSKRSGLNKTLRNLKEREERLILKLLPKHQNRSWRSQKINAPRAKMEDVIIMRADVLQFWQLESQLKTDELLNTLQKYFESFKSTCLSHDIMVARNDGTSFVALGGADGTTVSPRQALVAAYKMFETVQELNKSIGLEEERIGLRVAIHIGTLESGVPDGLALGFDYWGEALEVCRELEMKAKEGQILLSKEAYQSEVRGQQWPSFSECRDGEREYLIFKV